MKTIKDLISKIRIKINDSSSFEFSDDELISYIHAGITQLEMLLLSNRVKFNITMLQTQSNICPVPDNLLEIYKVIINDNTIPLKEEYSNSFGYFILNNNIMLPENNALIYYIKEYERYGIDDEINMKTENNHLFGNDGNDTITVDAANGANEIDGGAGDDIINVNSSNNTNIKTGDGNDNLTIRGNSNTADMGGGNDKLLVVGDSNNVTSTSGDNAFNVSGNKNTITGGSGNETIIVSGSENNVSSGTGDDDFEIYGDSNKLSSVSGENEFYIEGDSNTVNGGTDKDTVTIEGDKNIADTGSGNEHITVSGSENNVTSGDGDDNFDVNGNSNILASTSGNNEFDINGSYNEVTGGSGIDNIILTGDENIAQGGDENDIFVVQSGNLNNIDGNAGDRNLLYDNGVDTIYKNVIPVKYNPTEIRLQIGANTNDSITITLGVGFDDFELDFSTAESAAENIVKIDSLMEQINTQRAEIGAVLNRLDSVMTSQITNIENLTSSRSTIIDADIAEESAAFTKNQILQQTASALLAQSQNIHASLVLSLIG